MERNVSYLDNNEHVQEVTRMLLDSEGSTDDEGEVPFEEESDTDENFCDEECEIGRDIPSDDSICEEEEEDEENDGEFYIAHQKRNNKIIATWKWKKKNPFNQARRRGSQNVIMHLPGVKGAARSVNTVQGGWDLLIDEHILNLILKWTNKYILKIQEKFARPRDAKLMDLVELKAFIGLLYLAGVYRACHLNLKELWSAEGGVEIFRLTMGISRFQFLMRCIRFDDWETRQERRAVDRLAAIRECFEHYVENCQKYYCPGENLTLDEMLVAFRGKCIFRQYNPSKPARYGIKIFNLADARMCYTLNLEVYVGVQPEGPFVVSNSPDDVVKRLALPVRGSGRNLTMDNWFTSYSLLNDLKAMKLSMVGTMRKNKPQIPLPFKSKKRQPNSSLFGFQKDGTLVSYAPQANKCVILLSSLHFDNKIDDESGDKKKPEIITFYNKTKGGVDTVDSMCATYNVGRKTNRWPMVIFFTMLNTAGINSQILFTSNGNKVRSRRAYLRQLAISLVQEQLQRRRVTNTGLPLALSIGLKRLHSENTSTPTASTSEISTPDDTNEKRLPCTFCRTEKRRHLTKYKCHVCQAPLCLQHSRMRCQEECNTVDDLTEEN